MLEVWGAIAIFIVCPLLGGLPLIAWITYALTRRQLAELGTGNISVSAAFYHGGKLAGILAVLSEAFKGIAAVLLARAFFPSEPAWELVALIALVIGRYWMRKGAGTTNVVWGFVVHDWRVALLVFLIGGISFTILREKQLGRVWVLILFPLITALLHAQDSARIAAAIALAVLIGWIYKKIPDDLDLPEPAGQESSQKMFRFFRGDKGIVSLDDQLDASKVGHKAATLSQLKRWGYPVPMGWVLPAGDDPEPLIKFLQHSELAPLVVRSSAVGEDSEQASAAGQYETILNVYTREALQQAIARCQASYDNPGAVQYRRDQGLPEDAMAVLIQKQVRGVFSGVAFSRDPINQHDNAVVIEALPGDATQIVSGKITPEQYRVLLAPSQFISSKQSSWVLPEGLEIEIDSEGDIPPALIRQVAFLARHLESQYHGIPQDIEWSYDGSALWLLQSRPITTLLPIWTRKIAAEVIPGLIRPLTWSINRPLTCGVWGEIFTLVLGLRARRLDFKETATLHYSRAYFNASLLGQIFLRMGLPPESLEFLTRGAKFTKPPLSSTLQNVPGLLRLLGRELRLKQDFERDYQQRFKPALNQLAEQSASNLSPAALWERVDSILNLLNRATYYSILAPLSASLRQVVLRVKDTEIDHSQTPEVASLRSLGLLASEAGRLLPKLADGSVFDQLAASPEGGRILEQFDQLVDRYGYLSEVGTDIAVPTWKEDPQAVWKLFVQLVTTNLGENEPQKSQARTPAPRERREKRKGGLVQRRVDLKGRVTEVYSQLLAQLRWCFVELEQVWLQSGLLSESGDIFFLEFDEVRRVVEDSDSVLNNQLRQLVERRRSQLEQDSQLDPVPPLVYGNTPPAPAAPAASAAPDKVLQGIGASPGQVQGRVKVLRNMQAVPELDRETILVVPYTDSGWAPLLARAGGLIAEVGGRLSHGAIVAREYGIPAVMDIHNATALLRDGQRVQIDGSLGIVEIL
jgi:pyruvate,water dikinase